jgi:mannan endo-1,4-beta-mannosidase
VSLDSPDSKPGKREMQTRRAKIRLGTTTLALALAATLALAQIAPAASDPSRPGHHQAQKKVVPKQRGSYWGAWIGPQLTGDQPPWDMSAVSHFEGMVGKGLSLLEFAAPFADCSTGPCNFYKFPKFEMDTIRNYGAIPVFSWGSQSTPVPLDLNEPAFQLADINNGSNDSYIREFAEGARDWGHPFFLRFNWEMNGDWFPWAERANGNQAGEYVAAWRRVHDIFTQVGATNATWVWCPYVNSEPEMGPLAPYYPGDEYVDWTSLDGFNWANNRVNSQPWTSFDKIFSASYKKVVKKIAPSKPMLLAEMASAGKGHAKATWIADMFKVLRTSYPRIRGLIWFEQVDRGVQWPLETAPAVTQAFSRGIHQRGFKNNSFAALEGPKVVPPS